MGIILGLKVMNFSDFKAKNAILQSGKFFRSMFYIFPFFAMGSILLGDSNNSYYLMLNSISITTFAILAAESTSATLLPIWSFNIMYYIAFFDLVCSLYMIYRMKCLTYDIDRNP